MQGRKLYFYHRATKIATTVFGSLFSNIYVAKDDELVAVPIEYAGVPKHLIHNTNEDERNMVDRQLPMMAFNISSFTYDSVKKLGNNGEIRICCDDPNADDNPLVVGHASPWIVGFQLRIKTKTIDEGFQIIEQIIPYFSPTLTVDIKDFACLLGDCKYSRSDITLTGFDFANEYEGVFEDKREIEFTMDFSMTVPYWGFATGFPGVASGLGGGNQSTNGMVSIGTDWCNSNGLPQNYIENIFVNFMTTGYNGGSGPGIPEDPNTQVFLNEAGVEGHVSTTRVTVDSETDIVTTLFKDYPSEKRNYEPIVSADYVYDQNVGTMETIYINGDTDAGEVIISAIPLYGYLVSGNQVLTVGDRVTTNDAIILYPKCDRLADQFALNGGNQINDSFEITINKLDNTTLNDTVPVIYYADSYKSAQNFYHVILEIENEDQNDHIITLNELLSVVKDPENGTMEVVSISSDNEYLNIVDNGNNTYVISILNGFKGITSFTYLVSDGDNEIEATGILKIT